MAEEEMKEGEEGEEEQVNLSIPFNKSSSCMSVSRRGVRSGAMYE